jgi:hypothetical protein
MDQRSPADALEKILDNVCYWLKVFLAFYFTFLAVVLVRLIDFSSSYAFSSSHTCLNIESVIANASEVRIQFKRKISPYNPLHLSSFFGLWSSAYGLPLLMPPGSVHRARMEDLTLVFEFPLPFITDYSGLLFCADLSQYQAPPFQLPLFNDSYIVAKYPVNLTVPRFRDDLADTQILCHGDRPEARWCEARHIGIVSGRLVMQTRAHYRFPASFVSLGGRCAPFGDPQEVLNNKPLLTTQNIAELSVGVAAVGEIAFIVGNGALRDSSFGVIFDFLMPAFRTIELMVDRDPSKRFRFFVKNAGNRVLMDLVTILSVDPPVSLPLHMSLLIFEHAVLGLEKADVDCNGTRSDLAKYGTIYSFPTESARPMRDAVVAHYGMPLRPEKIIVTFLDSAAELRVENIEPLRQLVAKSCSFCEVTSISSDAHDAGELVKPISRSTVLIGRTGAGIEHEVWLPPDAFVIELRPWGYWCNDRFEMGAKAVGAKYYSVMNTRRIRPELEERGKIAEANECHSTSKYCMSHQCHWMLYWQKLEVELDVFNATWMEILKQIKTRTGDQ